MGDARNDDQFVNKTYRDFQKNLLFCWHNNFLVAGVCEPLFREADFD
jgi:hypothetical protein